LKYLKPLSGMLRVHLDLISSDSFQDFSFNKSETVRRGPQSFCFNFHTTYLSYIYQIKTIFRTVKIIVAKSSAA